MSIRSQWKIAVVLFAAMFATSAHADVVFRITEVVVEREISPRHAYHTVRWEGDYYVADEGVTVFGWGSKKKAEPIPYGQAHEGGLAVGPRYTSFFTRLPDGLDVRVEYGSYVLERIIRQTGPRTCSDAVTLTLKPGHTQFEVHRISNDEPMIDDSRRYTLMKCEFPPLIG